MVMLLVGACVLLLNAYAVILILLRSRIYQVPLYRPMLLNVGLSLAPLFLIVAALVALLAGTPALAMAAETAPWLSTTIIWVYLGLVSVIWVLLFPNSAYLITELNFSHRRSDDPVPIWYDIIQTLALTLSGIANALISLVVAQFGLIVLVFANDTSGWPPVPSWWFAVGVLLLGSFGVYLGRYLRFNSWDVKHPLSLIGKLWAHLVQPSNGRQATAFVLTHAMLLLLLYIPVMLLSYAAVVHS